MLFTAKESERRELSSHELQNGEVEKNSSTWKLRRQPTILKRLADKMKMIRDSSVERLSSKRSQ